MHDKKVEGFRLTVEPSGKKKGRPASRSRSKSQKKRRDRYSIDNKVPHLRVLLLTLLLPPQARALHPQYLKRDNRIQRVQSRKDKRQRVTKTNNTMDRSEKINDLG